MINESTGKTTQKNIQDIIQLMVKTFGQMKIFSFDHENVKTFAKQLFGHIESFLNTHRTLELGIEEFSFSYNGQQVYTDEQISKSLPFFFYKDGMKSLFFYQGLQKKEFLDFMEIIKRESSLPPEESDIVSAFWERDFTNIRYFAPDEYLETKIGAELDILDYEVNRDALYTGRIELTPEDQRALRQSARLAQDDLTETYKQLESMAETESHEDILASLSDLSHPELDRLENLIQNNRQTSPDNELIALVIEMMYLEKNTEKFSRITDVLFQCLQRFISIDDFAKAENILNSLEDVYSTLENDKTGKKQVLDRFHEKVNSAAVLMEIEKIYQQDQVKDDKALMRYLGKLGPQSLPLLSIIYEQTHSSQIRQMALNLMAKNSRQDPTSLLNLIQNAKPGLSQEVLKIIGEIGDKQVIPHLVSFLKYPHKDIRKSTLNTLGMFHDEAANKILAACLTDPEEDIRTLAIQNLHFLGDKSILLRILQDVEEKDFVLRSEPEKRAYFDYLASTASNETHELFMAFVTNPGRIARPRVLETGLLAIRSLKNIGSPAAESILQQGTKSKNKKIKDASQKALRRFTLKPELKHNTKD